MSNKYLIPILLLFFLSAISPLGISGVSAASNTNIQIYQDNYPAYLKHDKVLADTFLADYNNSEAQALVARAIWYMENGFMIYGHTKYWDTGFIDCSNFVSLVYKDLGYKITSASKEYPHVGEKIAGVYSRHITGSTKYELVGTEKLRPGDIFTFWAKDNDGSGTHIGHVAIYMGKINGQPAVIQTNSDRPTAIGIRTDFRYWYGEHFAEARRVLDDSANLPGKEWQALVPAIPSVYQLPPQHAIKMPEAKFMSYKDKDAANFNDIKGHWAEDNIWQLEKNKALNGYPDGTFQADKIISRAEFVTAVVRAFKITPKTGKVFSDTANHWAHAYIATAEGYKIISGYNEISFGPDDPITREQMAEMIVKAAQLDMISQENNTDIFTDSSQISEWAQDSVLIANQHKIICGYPDNTFKALAQASRGEAATIIINALRLAN